MTSRVSLSARLTTATAKVIVPQARTEKTVKKRILTEIENQVQVVTVGRGWERHAVFMVVRKEVGSERLPAIDFFGATRTLQVFDECQRVVECGSLR